jgi:hypothetical protein
VGLFYKLTKFRCTISSGHGNNFALEREKIGLQRLIKSFIFMENTPEKTGNA